MAYSHYFILFGGRYRPSRGDSETDVIAKFDPSQNQWSQIGKLQASRHAFGMIEVDSKFLVMGGEDDKPTEICELKNKTIECTSREPIMTEFRYFPAMMIVSSDFTNNC